MQDSVNVIIFSKDRACQLDALLQSFAVNFKIPCDVSVLYHTSEKEYYDGYRQAMNDWPINFLKQSMFKSDLEKLMQLSKYTMFLTDDDLFIRPVFSDDIYFRKFENDKSILALSLRYGRNITFHYESQQEVPQPEMHNNVWRWVHAPRGWDYPMSVDGNIFKTGDVWSYVHNGVYTNPNNFEAYMAKRPMKVKPNMVCYDTSRLFNIPMNRVQQKYKSRNEGVDAKKLNEEYLKGARFDINLGDAVALVNSVHYPFTLGWKCAYPLQ